MSNPTDAELEAMAVELQRFAANDLTDRAAAMLRACKGGAVKVKPLDWRESYGVLRAETPFGDYIITGKIVRLPTALRVEMVLGDTEAAKAAAQADYERRILSALEPAPAARQEAWRAGVKAAAMVAQRYGCCYVPQEIEKEIRALAEKGPTDAS